MTKAKYEMTDTFGGEANYSWVRRGEVEAKTYGGLVRAVKRDLGMTNLRCHKRDFGDMISLTPAGSCLIIFIYPLD